MRVLRLPKINRGQDLFGEDRTRFPDKQWTSVARGDFSRDILSHLPFLTPDQQPVVPPGAGCEREVSERGPAKNAFHIVDIGKKRICTVRSLAEDEPYYVDTPLTEHRAQYTTRPATWRVERTPRRTDTAARGIVPGSVLEPEYRERFLPSCQREKTVLMSTLPFLQYSGKKKHVQCPQQSNSRIIAQSLPADQPLLRNVSSLWGGSLSRRRQTIGPKDMMPVKDFDGGVPK